MTIWSWIGLGLGLLFLSDGLRMRRRLGLLSSLPPGSGPESDFGWVLAAGVQLEAAERAAACTFAEAQGLEVLDLLPGHWNVPAAIDFAQVVDVAGFRRAALAPGYTAGQAMLVRRSLLDRAGIAEASSLDSLEMLRCARKLKRYAPRAFDFAVATNLSATALPVEQRHAILRELFQDLTPPVIVGQLTLLALSLIAAAQSVRGGGALGWLGLAAYQLQAAVALLGAPTRAADLWWTTLFALPIQVWRLLAGAWLARPDPRRLAEVEALRPAYQEAIVGGLEAFFEPRSTECYVCGSAWLHVVRRQPDLFQHKPGRFTLEGCADCGHLFQNPRLTPAGLAYYYRDFYDGLGEDWLESVFGLSKASYPQRARELSTPPRRWLDVGGGYGHFTLLAKEVWPDTRFECLDVGKSATEAVRRGWADAAHRGFFPDLAPSLAGQFDVVSLSHCLEHTRDPRAELAAASQTLSSGGSLLVEVPDPECVLRHLFQGFWLPYFQPQHQHLLSVRNLSRLLGDAGFTIERVTRGPAHIGAESIAAAILILDTVAPPLDVPWRSAPSRWQRAWRTLVWSGGTPLLLGAFLLDALLERLAGLPGWSNAYRILARRSP